MNRQQITTIIRTLLSILLLGLLLAIIDRQALLEMFVRMDVRYYVLALAFYIATLFLWSWRWILIVRAGGDDTSLWRAFIITIVGNFFSMFLPSMVGNDLVRMVELSREGHSRSKSVSSVLLDRLFGLTSLVIVALIALLVGYRYVGDQTVSLLVVALSVGLALGWALFFNRTLMRRFRPVFKLPFIRNYQEKFVRLYHTLHHLHDQPRMVVSAMAVALILQIVEVISTIFIALALNIHIPAIYFFILMPLIWVVTTIPISLGGIGVREGAFVVLFAWVGVPSSEALAMSLLVYSLRVVTGILGGLIFLQMSLSRMPRKAQITQEDLISESKHV